MGEVTEDQATSPTPPTLSRDDIVAALVERGAKRDRAVTYADAFLEYREASKNIEENGTIVLHPRTANPVENPYLKIRDRALKKVQSIRGVKADFLW
jgi:hypothetical protein